MALHPFPVSWRPGEFGRRAASRKQETDTPRSTGTTSSPRATGTAGTPNRRRRHASSRTGREPLPSPSARPLRSLGGTRCGREPHLSRPALPATPCGIGSLAAAPIQSVFQVARVFRFREPVALVRPCWAVDVPRFVEVPIEPSPSVFRKAMLEACARAASPDGLLQDRVDCVPLDLGITWRGICTQRRRAGRARVGLMLRAAPILRFRRRGFRRLVAVPWANASTSGSPMPHDWSSVIRST